MLENTSIYFLFKIHFFVKNNSKKIRGEKIDYRNYTYINRFCFINKRC